MNAGTDAARKSRSRLGLIQKPTTAQPQKKTRNAKGTTQHNPIPCMFAHHIARWSCRILCEAKGTLTTAVPICRGSGRFGLAPRCGLPADRHPRQQVVVSGVLVPDVGDDSQANGGRIELLGGSGSADTARILLASVARDFLGILPRTTGELLGDGLGEGGDVRLVFLLPPLGGLLLLLGALLQVGRRFRLGSPNRLRFSQDALTFRSLSRGRLLHNHDVQSRILGRPPCDGHVSTGKILGVARPAHFRQMASLPVRQMKLPFSNSHWHRRHCVWPRRMKTIWSASFGDAIALLSRFLMLCFFHTVRQPNERRVPGITPCPREGVADGKAASP